MIHFRKEGMKSSPTKMRFSKENVVESDVQIIPNEDWFSISSIIIPFPREWLSNPRFQSIPKYPIGFRSFPTIQYVVNPKKIEMRNPTKMVIYHGSIFFGFV